MRIYIPYLTYAYESYARTHTHTCVDFKFFSTNVSKKHLIYSKKKILTLKNAHPPSQPFSPPSIPTNEKILVKILQKKKKIQGLQDI